MQFNSASPDCSKEKAELATIERKIQNGVKAIISGLDFPELQSEVDKLRTRKSELEDIIRNKEHNDKKIDPQSIVSQYTWALENWEPQNMKKIIRSLVSKIYANPDGSFTVEVGVHINGAGGGGRTHTVSPPQDFESCTSANSITPAQYILLYNIFH